MFYVFAVSVMFFDACQCLLHKLVISCHCNPILEATIVYFTRSTDNGVKSAKLLALLNQRYRVDR